MTAGCCALLLKAFCLFPFPWDRRRLAGPLVDQVKRWPGVHFAKSVLGGKPLKGLWFNRTEEFAARNRGEDFGRLKYAEEEELVREACCPCKPGVASYT